MFFFFKGVGLFTYLFLVVLGLRFCARAFSSCGKWRPLFIAVRGPLLLRSTGSRRAGSVIVAHGPSCYAACGISPARARTRVPCIGRRILNHCATREALYYAFLTTIKNKIFFKSEMLISSLIHHLDVLSIK